MSIGIPIKILHEAEGHTVTIETIYGETFRGQLAESEDNMNCHLSNVTYTKKDGKVQALEQAFVRGSKIRFVIIPDILKKAPCFQPVDQSAVAMRARGRGRGGPRGRGGRGGSSTGRGATTGQQQQQSNGQAGRGRPRS